MKTDRIRVLAKIRWRSAISRIQAVILVALIVVAFVGVYWYYRSTSPASEEIVIAAPLPLSGHDLAIEDIKAAGGVKALGGDKLKIVYGDITSDPAVTMSDTERFISTYTTTWRGHSPRIAGSPSRSSVLLPALSSDAT